MKKTIEKEEEEDEKESKPSPAQALAKRKTRSCLKAKLCLRQCKIVLCKNLICLKTKFVQLPICTLIRN